MNVLFKFNLSRFSGRRGLLCVFLLLFVLVLVFVCFVLVFTGVFSFGLWGSDKVVSNEFELRAAVNNAAGPTSIAFSKDIALTALLVIPTGKDITLTSNRVSGFYKLIGYSVSTITVEAGGVLRLDGITVTNKSGAGRGVMVNSGGKLFLCSGEISGNHGVNSDGGGGGVYVSGSFVMSGGKISDNTAFDRGGGVYLFSGSFSMSGGSITNNKAYFIVDNNRTVYGAGGGVYAESEYSGSFSMSGGRVSGNIAVYGGGVHLYSGSFSMSGGRISGNTADWGGGIYISSSASFSRTDGEISGNTSSDVYTFGNNNESPNSDSSNDLKRYSLSWDAIIWIGLIVIIVCVVVTVLFFTSNAKLEL